MLQTKFVEKIKTHILCSITQFPKIVPFMRYVEKCNKAKEATDDITGRRKDVICMPNKQRQNTDRNSECVILIVLPQQPWLHEIASMLRYTYV